MHVNAEWIENGIAVEREGSAARADFVRKTYVHFLLGLIAFCAATYGLMRSSLLRDEFGNLGGPLMTRNAMIISGLCLVALSFFYHRLFASRSLAVHYGTFALVIALEAVITAPLFAFVERFAGGGVIRDAFMLTGLGFGGLTGLALISRKDFTFLGGILSVATMLLIGIALVSLFWGGFNFGLVWSAIVILVYAGWVLHTTSMIQHHLPMTGYVYGATMLLIEFVVILRQVLVILMSRER